MRMVSRSWQNCLEGPQNCPHWRGFVYFLPRGSNFAKIFCPGAGNLTTLKISPGVSPWGGGMLVLGIDWCITVFNWLLNSWRCTKLATLQYFCLGWDGLLLKGKDFWLILFNTEDKHRNGDSLCPTDWAYLENMTLLPPLSRKWANSPVLPHLSRKLAYFWKLPLLPPPCRTWAYFWKKTRLCYHLCPESGLVRPQKWSPQSDGLVHRLYAVQDCVTVLYTVLIKYKYLWITVLNVCTSLTLHQFIY